MSVSKTVFIVLDVETGNLNAETSPITQLALEIIEPTNFKILESYDTFVKPYDDLVIVQDALNSSRVTMDEINKGITADKLLEKLVEIIKRHIPKGSKKGKNLPILVGHNINFDRSFLSYLFKRRSKHVDEFLSSLMYDTLRMSQDIEMLDKDSAKLSNKLEVVCERYGIKLKAAHGAPADVVATRLLFTHFMKNLRNANSREKKVGSGRETTEYNNDSNIKSRNFFELP